MKKAIVFGIGNNFKTHESYLQEKYDIVAYVDNNTSKHGSDIGCSNRIMPPKTILDIDYDTVIVTPDRAIYEIIRTQLLEMGVQADRIMGLTEIEVEHGLQQYRSIFGQYSRQKNAKLISSICRPTDLESITEWKDSLRGIRQGNMAIDESSKEYIHNRKTWEFIYISQVLKERGMLGEGMKGLGFACGKEPLPSIFACHGCTITATDAQSEISGEGWRKTNQHSDSCSDLFYAHIVDQERFARNVTFRYVDMNSIPDDERDYDFIWSACALEHLGSIHAAKDFIYKAMNCLKPGGVAVHTMEFNLTSSFDTLHRGNVSVLRSIDLIEIAENLAWQGHRIEPLDFRLDGSAKDNFVAYPPYIEPHFKMLMEKLIITSFGLIVYNGKKAA